MATNVFDFEKYSTFKSSSDLIKVTKTSILQSYTNFVLENAPFFADRTNVRAYATELRLSVCRRRLWCYVLWLNGAS